MGSSFLRPLLLGIVVLATFPGLVAAQGPQRAVLLHPDNAGWTEASPAVFRARFRTSRGDFVIEVHRDASPRGADRFYNLVRFGYFDDSRVSRVVPGFIVQFGIAGDPAVNEAWKGRTIRDDSVRESNVRGAIAFATTGPDTRHTQIYISLVDNTRLDAQGFSPFGGVVEGMAVVDSLYGGYGENSGGGMRAGHQGRLLSGGNAYIDREYPLLDRIIRATIER
jgi:cyclophilin family peptidyl-prolyl cis-trans isomerase